MVDAWIEIATDDGVVDAYVVSPDTAGPHAPILLLPDRRGVTPEVRTRALRLSAHNYFVLAPNVAGRPAEARRDAVWSALDHLADVRDVDDGRVGVLGFGSGADLGLWLAAWRSERVAAVAAYEGRGFAPAASREIASRVNGVIRFGYAVGRTPARVGALEHALCEAGVLFDLEVYEAEPDWPGLLDFFGRALGAGASDGAADADVLFTRAASRFNL